MRRQSLVECRVDDRHLGNARKSGSGDFYPEQIRGVVKWSQRDETSYRLDHLVIDHGRFPKEFPTMDHPVAHAEELGTILNDPVFSVHMSHELEGLTVICERLRMDLLVEASVGVAPALSQAALTGPDLLDEPRCKHGAVRQAENFVFDGRTSTVNDSHLHGVTPSA
jgi:hypothetical protein